MCIGRRKRVLSATVRADYDSWRDDIDPGRLDIERGDGFALGGQGTFRRVRPRQRWRETIIARLRLVLLDMAVLVMCALSVFLLLLIRSAVFLAIAAVTVAFTGLWFRHQRLEHERRPR